MHSERKDNFTAVRENTDQTLLTAADIYREREEQPCQQQ
jgi:hypothetical protein